MHKQLPEIPNEPVKETLNKPLPKYLYHASWYPLWDEIKDEGLVPDKEGMMHNFPDIEAGVYLSTHPNNAGSFLETTENRDIPEDWAIMIITIDASKLDTSKMDIDPNIVWHVGEEPTAFIYRGVVPTSAFVKVEDY
jgi:hypothetical protein